MENFKLTQYSHGAGCGCKISPAVLDSILHSDSQKETFADLLVGNESKDDAAVFDVGGALSAQQPDNGWDTVIYSKIFRYRQSNLEFCTH